tara:strand:+ start:94 stop:360 length:267 start_codon:yes stop_codon:yes gene_type:complete
MSTHNEKDKQEVIRFYYFSEGGVCGQNSTAKDHEEYCNGMLAKGYTLVRITPLGNLDKYRDSYEGTLIYQWKLDQKTIRGSKEELNTE